MGWFWTLFVFGGFWFWLLVVGEVLWLFGCMAKDKGTPATVSAIVFATLLALCGGPNIFRFARDSPKTFALCIGGYIIAGTLWSIIKWWFYVRKQRRMYDDAKFEFLKSRNISDQAIPAEFKRDWQSYIGYQISAPPQVREHKADILFWMTFWPFSLIWTMLDDVVTKIFEEIYNGLQNFLQSISNRAFRGIENDLPGKNSESIAVVTPPHGRR